VSKGASTLVAEAKKWASYYGSFANGEEGAVLTVPLRIRAAWDSNDPDAFTDNFAENGSLLIGDNQLNGHDEIRSYMTEAFQGGLQGTHRTEEPVEIRPISGNVALAVTEGGIIKAGANGLAPEDAVRSSWIIVKQDGNWKLFSLQSSPVKG
jgi:uncharacterized protein (TIGR02246 family)